MGYFISETDTDNQVFLKAKAKNMPTFTLIARDPTSIELMRRWLDLNPKISDETRNEVLKRIEEFANYPERRAAD